MPLDIDKHVESIIQARRGMERTFHIWLSGFNEIVGNACLSQELVERFLEEKAQYYLPFTRLTSGSFISHYKDLVLAERLFSKHLPFNNKYHLQFPLLKKERWFEFMYETCDRCNIIESHGFPIIEIRKSMLIPEENFNKNYIFLDNHMSPDYVRRDILYNGYKAMQEFVEFARI